MYVLGRYRFSDNQLHDAINRLRTTAQQLKSIDLNKRCIRQSLEIIANNRARDLIPSEKYSCWIQKAIVAALRATGLSIEV
jgi:hypothetical protein